MPQPQQPDHHRDIFPAQVLSQAQVSAKIDYFTPPPKQQHSSLTAGEGALIALTQLKRYRKSIIKRMEDPSAFPGITSTINQKWVL